MNNQRLAACLAAVGVVLALMPAADVQAAGTTSNPILGTLNPTSPSANPYSGCVAGVLVGLGVVFPDVATLGSTLAAVWAGLPSDLAGQCRQAIDAGHSQICVDPPGAICNGLYVPDLRSLLQTIEAATGAWAFQNDTAGCCGGFAEAELNPDRSHVAAGSVTGTFQTPSYICTSPQSCPAADPGLYSNCGPFTCGPITWFKVTFIGRTPDLNQTPTDIGWGGHIHAVEVSGTSCTTPMASLATLTTVVGATRPRRLSADSATASPGTASMHSATPPTAPTRR